MPSLEDLLLKKFLISNKFSTPTQVSECLEIQEKLNPSKPLGEIMLEKGYITEAQLNVVSNFHKKPEDSDSGAKEGGKTIDNLFGKIVLMKKLAREGQIEECLRLQSELKEKEGKYLKLGEILIQKAYLTKYQVEEVLRIQQDHKQAFCCQVCGSLFVMEKEIESVKYRCPKCKIVLTFPKSK